jgi:F-type H+-transporting ATPase subunit b
MDALALQVAVEGGGRIEQVARTFGVSWPLLVAQIISFSIVCAVLYVLAYKPILQMLNTRRQQIADGLANAERIRAELARTEVARREVLMKAEAAGKQLIEDARVAAARVWAQETQKAAAAAERVIAEAREEAARDRARMLAEIRRDIGRLVVQTTAAVAGKVLTPEDHRRLTEETIRQLAA